MPNIVSKSGILQWNNESIELTPSKIGVYVLRDLPTINGIVYIAYSDNLKESLKEKFVKMSNYDIAWFDWYEVDTKDYGEKITQEWIGKYSPKYNLS